MNTAPVVYGDIALGINTQYNNISQNYRSYNLCIMTDILIQYIIFSVACRF